MAKQTAIEQDGVILEALSSAMFETRSQDGHIITAHISGRMHMHFIRILPGDRIEVEISPYNPTRGRISYRYR